MPEEHDQEEIEDLEVDEESAEDVAGGVAQVGLNKSGGRGGARPGSQITAGGGSPTI